jgi:hypothetical protein
LNYAAFFHCEDLRRCTMRPQKHSKPIDDISDWRFDY